VKTTEAAASVASNVATAMLIHLPTAPGPHVASGETKLVGNWLIQVYLENGR